MTPDSEPVFSTPPRARVKRYLFLLILVGISSYLVLPHFANIEHALRVAATLRLPFVVLALIMQTLSYFGSGYLLKAVVRLGAKPISVIDGALVTLGANSVGTLGGGMPGTVGVTYFGLRQRGVNPAEAALGGWIPIALNDVMMAIVSLVGFLVFILLKKLSGLLAVALSLAVLILAGGLGTLVWCLNHREKLRMAAIAIASVTAKLRRKTADLRGAEVATDRLLEGWDKLLQGGWRTPVAGAGLNIGFDILTLAFLFLSAGHGVSPLVLLAGYGVPQLLGKLTVILGGIGIVETTMVGMYAVLGVPTPVSVVVVLVYRLFSLWIPTLVGIALVPYLGQTK